MISAVVVTYNSASCIGECLGSLSLLGGDTQIVVVDNASADDTVATVRRTAPHAHIIELPDNVGFGRASNAGVEASKGTHALFVNPDTVITDVDTDALTALLAERPFGLAAPALDDEPNRERQETSWQAEYFAQTFATLRPRDLTPRPAREASGSSSWVSAALLLVARDEFLDLGGFDPRFFLYYEDRDLSRRYRRAGLPIRTTSALRGRHEGTASSGGDDLRVAPMGWSLLGWIQFVRIHDGERAARRAARAALSTLQLIRLGLTPFGRWQRARRKRRQLDSLLEFVRTQPAEGEGFVPDATAIVRRS